MIAQINEQLWVDFDLDTAVFLDTIAYWLKKNASNKQFHNFQDGQYWTYNTQEAFQKMFPGWKRETIRRVIRNCIKNDLLILGNFNSKGYDRTRWYSLTSKSLEYYPNLKKIIHEIPDNPDSASLVGSHPSLVGSHPAIPKQLPSVSNINITISDSGESPKADNEDIVNAYHEALPECPKIKVIDSKLKRQLYHMRKNWHKYQKDGKHFSIESFKDYLLYIKQHYGWFIKPYVTANGTTKHNNLRVLTREINITKIVNGEFSAN